MLCRKCKKEIPDNSIYCNFCGTKQIIYRSAKSRGNGQGSVYKEKNGKWTAEITLGYEKKEMPDGSTKLLRKRTTKKGFSTKKAALEYLPQLHQVVPSVNFSIKFKDHYEAWLAIHERKVTNDTVNCYKAAYKYFSPLYYVEISKIRTEHLQKCVDECPKGTRTKKNMKSLTTALWRYAIQNDIVDRNYAEFIYIPPEEKTEKTAFTSEQIELMWQNVALVPELKYVLVLIYTGMRIGEMISALSEKYHKEEQYFITGSKTKAGKDRVITISPRILPFFKDFGKGEYLFFDSNKKIAEKYFRNNIYYAALEKIGLDVLSEDGTHLYNPHCCRHTFATMMKNVDAPATDKQKLIGHSKFEMTAYYTHTDIDSLKQITDKL
ncbi:MAG: tyrosine-type recombinase/integrase [Clostridia bacterium]|nr:tyrosine-type recombinase/integrase [Clostridia bacterium]